MDPTLDPSSMESSRQEYWSALPFPSAADLPDPEIEPISSDSAGMFFSTVSHYAVFIPVSLFHFIVLDR